MNHEAYTRLTIAIEQLRRVLEMSEFMPDRRRQLLNMIHNLEETQEAAWIYLKETA